MRNMLKTLLITSVLTLAGPVFAIQLSAGETYEYGAAAKVDTADSATMQGGGVSLSQAVEQVRRQYKGRIVSAVTKVKGKREVHVIKVLTDDGKVRTVEVQGKQRS
ncbi:MAG: hypothetical protein DRQ63_03470 [Gammaproteobacteria bacterium]|nr:MAG: hypothetical protein DRQ63_03470 [Gammaproteobacteria bacterium]